jgi:hypothetical protein
MQQTRTAAVAISDHVGFLDRLDRLQSGQPGMTWSDTDEPDPAHTTTPIPTRDMGRQIRGFG